MNNVNLHFIRNLLKCQYQFEGYGIYGTFYYSSPEPNIQSSFVDHMSSMVYLSVCWSVGIIPKKNDVINLSFVKLNKYGSVMKFHFFSRTITPSAQQEAEFGVGP